MKYPIGKLNLVKIQDAIYTWIRDETKGVLPDEERIIWRNQSEPLPPRPCVTLKITDGPRPVGRQGSVLRGPDQKSYTIGMQMEMTLSIQIYGNTKVFRPVAHQLAIDLNSSLLKAEVLTALNQGGAAVQQVGDPQNISALEETEWEERFAFEVQFGLAQNIVSKPGTIQTVNAELDISGHTIDKTIPL